VWIDKNFNDENSSLDLFANVLDIQSGLLQKFNLHDEKNYFKTNNNCLEYDVGEFFENWHRYFLVFLPKEKSLDLYANVIDFDPDNDFKTIISQSDNITKAIKNEEFLRSLKNAIKTVLEKKAVNRVLLVKLV